MWFCPDDPKGVRINGLLPAGVAQRAGATLRHLPGQLMLCKRVPHELVQPLVKALEDFLEQARWRGFCCQPDGYVRGPPPVPYYETGRTMASIEQKPRTTI